ncbi:MAG: serine/threonine-protein kinase [Myxococcota bacterium]
MPRPLGAYVLVRRIATGGMSEIYAAKASGIRQFDKRVAIKVIHPRYSQDEYFVHMLIEEANIAIQLSHRNICQVFGLERDEDTYFIVMEYIEGVDLHRTIRRARERNYELPVALCAHLMCDVCRGLDFVHRKRGVDGRALGIVHRDISPRNVLVSFAGETKIIDFGVAKAAVRSQQTEVGVIRGKPQYMSPEQAWADPVDARSDVFSAGLVLYEMLTGEVAYPDAPFPVLLDRIRQADFAPILQIRPKLPKEMNQIMTKALACDPDDRFGTAADFGQALTEFVQTSTPSLTSARVAEMMVALFPDEVALHVDMVDSSRAEDPGGASSPSSVSDWESSITVVDDLRDVRTRLFAQFQEPATNIALGDAAPPSRAQKVDDPSSARTPAVLRRFELKWLRLPVAVMMLVLCSTIAANLIRQGSPSTSLLIRTVPEGASVLLDGREIEGLTPLTVGEELHVGRPVNLEITLEGYETWTNQTTPTRGVYEEVVVLRPSRVELRVSTDPAGAAIFRDGIWVGDAPLTLEGLPLGQAVRLRANLPGHRDVSRTIRTDSSELHPSVHLDLQPKPLSQ